MNTKGITLLELLVALVMFSIIALGMGRYFVNQNRAFSSQVNSTMTRQDVRAAMDILTRELRMAGYNPAGAAFDGVEYNTEKLIVRADLDGDGSLTGENEDVEYQWNGDEGVIYRTVGDVKSVLIDKVENFSFEYRDKAGKVIDNAGDAGDIEQVALSIGGKVQPAQAGKEMKPWQMTTTVLLRNLIQ